MGSVDGWRERERKDKIRHTIQNEKESPYLSFDLLAGGGVMTSLERRSLSNNDLTSLRCSSECWGQFMDLEACM